MASSARKGCVGRLAVYTLRYIRPESKSLRSDVRSRSVPCALTGVRSLALAGPTRRRSMPVFTAAVPRSRLTARICAVGIPATLTA
jgi:hypothetical protein